MPQPRLLVPCRRPELALHPGRDPSTSRRPLHPKLDRATACTERRIDAFSSQTFSPTYWLKRPDLLPRVFALEVNGAGHRQQGRVLDAGHATVQRHVERLGRHCLLAHEAMRDHARDALPHEPVVLDGLRSFAGGQFWPVEITSLMGSRSYYSHDFVVSERRRSGTMTDRQAARRARFEELYGRPDPAGLRKDVSELLAASLPQRTSSDSLPIELRSDEEPAYPRALRRLGGGPIDHQRTISTAPRTPDNPLFAINAHHALMRHSGANLKRESIAFSKRLQGVIYRHAIFQVWVNRVKCAAERDPGSGRAQRLGLARGRIRIPELLVARLFPTRMKLRQRIQDYYGCRVRSRFLPRERGHALKYAF